MRSDFLKIVLLVLLGVVVINSIIIINLKNKVIKQNEDFKIKKNEDWCRFFDNTYDFSHQNILNQDLNFSSVNNYNEPLLVYFYSDETCEKCVYFDLGLLKKQNILSIDSDVFILPILENSRNTRIRLNTELKGFNYQQISPEVFHIPNRNGTDLKFFAMYNQGIIEMPFVTEFNDSISTIRYLKFVKEKYFTCNE